MAEPTLSNALPTVAAHNIKSENCEPLGSYINPKIEYWNEVLIELDNLKK